MKIAKSYITYEDASIKSLVMDFETFKRLENILLDGGLAKAMDEVESEDEFSLEKIEIF